MLTRLQWLFAGLCAAAIVLPTSIDLRDASFAYVWQLDDGPHFLIWLGS